MPEIALQTQENCITGAIIWIGNGKSERELGGIRYLDASLENEQLKISCDRQNEQEFREMESLFREDSLSVFPLRYSPNEWEFRYARDKPFFSGVMLGDFRDAQPANAAVFKNCCADVRGIAVCGAGARSIAADDRDQLPGDEARRTNDIPNSAWRNSPETVFWQIR